MSVTRAMRLAACLLLLVAMAGCRHPAPLPPPPPPPVKAAPITPATITVITPLPSIPAGTTQPVQQGTPAPPPVIAAKKPPPRRHHLRRRPADATVAANNEAAAVAAGAGDHSPAVSPTAPTAAPAIAPVPEPDLGQLSTGTALTGRQRDRLLKEIAVQESRLKKQPVSAGADSSTELTQAETFLAKARQAVDENDLDGASTLTTKARVLLDEMEKQ